MRPYHTEGLRWAKELTECSDEGLISRHNQSVGLRCFGYARQMYLGCLERELLARDFDSSVLFERDSDDKVTSYRLSFKIEILKIKGRGVLVPIAKLPNP
jgi:hypothetical protein